MEYECKYQPQPNLYKRYWFVALQRQTMIRSILKNIFLLALMAGVTLNSIAQNRVEQDISSRLIPTPEVSNDPGAVLNFQLTASDKGTILVATSRRPFSVFVRERLVISSITSFRWNVDSLNQTLGYPEQLTVFWPEKSPVHLSQVRIIPRDPLDPEFRKRSSGLDFGIIGWFLVVILFSLLLATLTRGASGFFSLWKAFAISIREDRPDEIKANSTSAVLIFLFTILLASVSLTLLAGNNLNTSADYFYLGLQNFLILLALMILRNVLISFMSWLFRMKEISDHQITGFFQVGLMVCLLASGILLINFLLATNLDSAAMVFDYVAPLFLAAYYLTLFLRLKSSTNSSALHLFSYLCLSEFIPLVILVFTF